MGKTQEKTVDKYQFAGVFGLALLTRLLLLGKFPLREVEAKWAYQAWELWQGQRSGVGAETAYLSLTRGLFAIFGDSNWMARLVPAFTGSAMVWLPYFIRKRLGRVTALLMAVGLALDPGLVATSRAVGSPILASGTLFLAMALISRKKYYAAAAVAGLFLLSGPGQGMGLLILGATILLARAWGLALLGNADRGGDPPPVSWGRVLLILTGVIFLVGSSFLAHLDGISAWLESIPAFFTGWGVSPSVPLARIFVPFLAYQPLALIFGPVGAVQGLIQKEDTSRFFLLWCLVGLSFILLYPGRQVWDLVWVLVPLWGLAAQAIARLLQPLYAHVTMWILAGLIFILFALMWLSFSSLATQPGDPTTRLLHWGMIAATIILGIISTSIVAAEKTWALARTGVVFGVSFSLFLSLLSGMVTSGHLKADDPRTLWLPDPGISQVSLLTETLQEVSKFHTGRSDSIDIVVQVDHGSLKWALRDFVNARFLPVETSLNNPLVIITPPEQAERISAQGYVGQDFVHHTFLGWGGAFPPDWKKWVAFREGPVAQRLILLWVRDDALPGGELLLGKGEGQGVQTGE